MPAHTIAATDVVRLARRTLTEHATRLSDTGLADTGTHRFHTAIRDVTVTVRAGRRIRATIAHDHGTYTGMALAVALDIDLTRAGADLTVADRASIDVIDDRTHELTW